MRGIIKFEKKSLLPLTVGGAVFALGFFAMSAAGAGGTADSSVQEQKVGPLVETTSATRADGHYSVEAPGRLQARQQLTIVAEVSGKVSYLNPNFVMGGRLKEGDTLFRINSADYQAEVSRAEAALQSAEATLVQAKLANKRQLDLVKQGAASEAAKDSAIANLAAAEAGVLQARSSLIRAQENLSRTTIKAPFPALVANESLSNGTYVAPGQALGELIDTRTGELVAGLSPAKAVAVSRMFKGGTRQLKAIAKANSGSVGSASLEGYIDQFSPTIDETSRSALVVAVFPGAFDEANEGRIFANDFMTLGITVEATETVWQVPAGTVRKGRYLWLVNDGALERRNVTVVESLGDITLITSTKPLEGAQILVTLLSEESDGLKVRSTPSTTLAAR